MTSRMQVPFFRPSIDGAEIAEVVACLRSGWLTTGPRTKQFETAFARAGRRKTRRGRQLLHRRSASGRRRPRPGPGQAVLVPTMTFAATAEVVRYQGAVPLLVDCDPVTLEHGSGRRRAEDRRLHAGQTPLDPRLPRRGHHSRPRRRADDGHGPRSGHLPPSTACGSSRTPPTAFPAAYQTAAPEAGGRRTALVRPLRRKHLPPCTCFSFYANKTITTGEGGMAVTDDDKLADRMRQMSLHGLSHDAWKRFAGNNPWDYRIVAPGYKYNLTDIAAAIGIHQLARAEDMRQQREAIARRFRERLWPTSSRLDLPPDPPDRIHAWHLFPIRLRLDRLSIDRNAFMERSARARRGLLGALAAAASASVLRRDVPLAAGASARGVAAMAAADQSAAVSRHARRRAEPRGAGRRRIVRLDYAKQTLGESPDEP